MQWTEFLEKRKYELLLVALIQHLFIGIFMTELTAYTRVIWPINMVIVGLGSLGVLSKKNRWERYFRNWLFFFLLALPLCLPWFHDLQHFMEVVSLVYVFFFIYTFLHVFRFLIRPGYINVDIISACAGGYLLLIEISVFLMQFLYYPHPASFPGVDGTSPASIYIDFVYFSSIVQTTIGFGDISPATPAAKLVTAFLGIAGQFYTVVLIGLLISKFSSSQTKT